ncbi:J domain-containing protein [Zavarzinia sp. CC-PAN008]|uniref:J domain-containing protein n=1 Tax=Zavarzinia sp. CC-PAN008 TaxID=3243332 RepID=UPI003F749321
MRRRRSAFAGEVEDEVAGERACDADGCANPGRFRAPRRRASTEPLRWLCLDHIREANASWNYFEGMGQDDLVAYQRNDPTWHRPTWKMGQERRLAFDPGMDDPLGILTGVFGLGPAGAGPQPEPSRERRLPDLVRRAFEALDMSPSASFQDIKTRYKELVKRYHPDLNGGDRSSEERLKQVIQAYNHLRASGYC